jgi:hypothetical protein
MPNSRVCAKSFLYFPASRHTTAGCEGLVLLFLAALGLEAGRLFLARADNPKTDPSALWRE